MWHITASVAARRLATASRGLQTSSSAWQKIQHATASDLQLPPPVTFPLKPNTTLEVLCISPHTAVDISNGPHDTIVVQVVHAFTSQAPACGRVPPPLCHSDQLGEMRMLQAPSPPFSAQLKDAPAGTNTICKSTTFSMVLAARLMRCSSAILCMMGVHSTMKVFVEKHDAEHVAQQAICAGRYSLYFML